jgi:hypothetical protein
MKTSVRALALLLAGTARLSAEVISVPVRLTAPAGIVALQFDVLPSISGVTILNPVVSASAPVSTRADRNNISSGATRFVLYTTDREVFPAGPVSIDIQVDPPRGLLDLQVTVRDVVLSDSNGATVATTLGLAPVARVASWGAAPVGGTASIYVQAVDPDQGTISFFQLRSDSGSGSQTIASGTGNTAIISYTPPSAGLYQLSVVAQDAQGFSATSPVSLLRIYGPGEVPNYAAFASLALASLDAAQRDPLADPDGDGIRNQLEYFTMGNPFGSGSQTHTITREKIGNQDFVVLHFRKLRVSDIAWQITASASLGPSSWLPLTPANISITDNGDGTDSVAGFYPIGTGGKVFLRLETDR